MTQFTCDLCGEEFDQKSRYERHMMTSHPQQAVSAADVEKVVVGIDYPQEKDEILAYAEERTDNEDILEWLQRIPERTYRDAAELAIALGEVRAYERREIQEQPGVLGGREAARGVSAAGLAKVLTGITFPCSKAQLQKHALQHLGEVEAGEQIMDKIWKMPERVYSDMADVEKAAAEVD